VISRNKEELEEEIDTLKHKIRMLENLEDDDYSENE